MDGVSLFPFFTVPENSHTSKSGVSRAAPLRVETPFFLPTLERTRAMPELRRHVLYINLDEEVFVLLRELAPGPRKLGKFVAQLSVAEGVRREDRQRLARDRQDAEMLVGVGK